MKTSMKQHRSSERGMTLMEALIAVFIFTIVFLTALALYQSANRAYLQTDAAAIQQQNIRFGMDRMLETLRDAGAAYNTLGSSRLADEQIEGAWESAVFVRGNFDNKRENEVGNNLESSTTAGFSIVTTGNDEIVGYVLRKPGANTQNISVKLDLSRPRDAILTSQTNISNEETRTIQVAATTVAQQTDPPYQLTKVTFDNTGNVQYEVVADNVYAMKFEYFGAAGRTLASDAIITAASGSGSGDTERDERASVRRIRVKLMGMADRPDFGYKDPWQYGADFADLQSTLKPDYHKFPLEEMVLSTNLGIVGRKHNTVPAITLTAPTSITVCTGHCRYFHIEWPASVATGVTDYSVQVSAPAASGQPAYLNTFSVSGILEYVFQDPDPTGVVRNWSFQVAAQSGGVNGTFTSAATLASSNDNTNSVPAAPGNVTAGASGNAMNVQWNQIVSNTGTVTAPTYCISAGSLSGGSAPPSTPCTLCPADVAWNQTAIDLSYYKVFRVRSDGSNNGSNATIRADTLPAIGPLANTTPASGTTAFTDNLAAPCTPYFYRVQGCDLCDLPAVGVNLSTAMSTAVSVPDPSDNPDAPGGVNRANAVTGVTSESTTDYTTILNWPAVTQTASGRRAATAHYKVYRFISLDGGPYNLQSSTPSNPNPIDVLESTTTGTTALTLTDTQSKKVTGRDAAYQYYVTAAYTNCGRESQRAGPYTVSCSTTATFSIEVPVANTEISIPFESGFTPRVTVTPPSGGTISGATATITGPDGSNSIVWSDVVSGAGPTFSFTPFSTAPSLSVGTYQFNVYAIVNGCKTQTESTSFHLGNATCGLAAANLSLDPSSGNPKYYYLSFNVQNTCDPNQGGLTFTVTGMRLTWTGFGGSKTIKEARLDDLSPSNPIAGTLLTSTPLNTASDAAFLFLTSPDRSQVIPAGTTSTYKWVIIYNGEMRESGTNGSRTTWTHIIANTTTPSNANDEILAGDYTP